MLSTFQEPLGTGTMKLNKVLSSSWEIQIYNQKISIHCPNYKRGIQNKGKLHRWEEGINFALVSGGVEREKG